MTEITVLNKKRKISLNQKTCCFCFKEFANDKPTSLDVKSFDSLLDVCKERKDDDTSIYLLQNEYEIKNGNTVIKYHKSCRSAFMRTLYTNSSLKSCEDPVCQSSSDKFTRSKDFEFDWKQCCFICGDKCSEKKRSTWSLVESAVSTKSSMYTKVIEAAHTKNDQKVIKRLLSVNGDLVAAEARYHRNKGCLARYLKTTSGKQANTSKNEKGNIDTICLQVKDKLKDDIQHVYAIKEVKEYFCNVSKDEGLPIEHIKTKKLKRVFNKNWPEVQFISRPGLSTVMCSSTVSLDDAMFAACKYGNRLATISTENVTKECLSNSFTMAEDDDQILHKAAGILRDRIMQTKTLNGKYYSYEEVTLEEQRKFVGDDLYKFFSWITSQSKYENACNNSTDVQFDQRVLAVCCDVINAATSIITPKHLGLSVHLHHVYGSRKIIDDLHVLGYTLSYPEVRRFLTSAAVHMTSKQTKTESGGLVPDNIKHSDDGGKVVVGVFDNWDHNDCTRDGKNTTHAMTSILVTPKSNKMAKSERITRVPEKKIDSSSLPGGNLSFVLSYQKPNERPSPYLCSKPTDTDDVKLPEPQAAKIMKLKELMYNMGRLIFFCDDRFESNGIAPWTIFQSKISPDQLEESSEVFFNPIIMSAPNSYNTVYTTLKRVKEQMNELGQTSCPVFFDMGLLTKALEVVWARKTELHGVIPMEGGMHFLMAVFAGIGFLYGDTGLWELLSESDVFARNTVKQILAGKDFDRGISAFLMVDEVLNARLLANFKIWCESRNILLPEDRPSLYNSDDLPGVLSYLETSVVPLLDEFRMKGREISPTFQFWDDYLKKVSEPFKLFLSSSRHAEWEVNEYAKSLFLPFFFASNRTVYAKYMPYMVLNMQRLPDDLKDSFSSGNFVTKLTDGSFNAVWYDYCLEVTENKALKSHGGIIGLTHKDDALCRWFLARPLTALYSYTFTSEGLGRTEREKTSSSRSHHTDNTSYRKSYDNNVQSMQVLFDQTFLDPFCLQNPPRNLVNFATGVSMEAEVENSLLNCFQKGLECLEQFVQERFVENPGKSFYDPVIKANVKTVKQKQKRVRFESKELPINGEDMYLRLLAFNSLKKVPLQRVMAYENSPVPLSLFTDSGEMLSTKKADFMSKLEDLVKERVTTSVPAVGCIIFDGMAVVQMLHAVIPSITMYKDIDETFWHFILSKSSSSQVIHVVFDSYFEHSAKSQTRVKRGENQSTSKSFVIQPEMKAADLKQALCHVKFKKELTRYYTLYLAENCSDMLKDGHTVVVSGGLGDKVVGINSQCVYFIPGLCTNQEEADTKMLLHAKYVSERGIQAKAVFSPDTDVLLLLVHHFQSLNIPRVYFRTGRKSVHTDLTRCIPVHDSFQALSTEQRHILLPVYCITGCDTCSSFYGIGKKTAFNLMWNKASSFQAMGCLGDITDLTGAQIVSCIKFVGELYGQTNCTSLTSLRTERVLKGKSVKPRRLPPTDDSFMLHLQRCLLQLLVWKRALFPTQMIPCLTNYGHIIDAESGLAIPQLMTQPAAAPELLSDLVCDCADLCVVAVHLLSNPALWLVSAKQLLTVPCVVETYIPI